MMLPFQVTIIPLYLIFNSVLQWGNSFLIAFLFAQKTIFQRIKLTGSMEY